MRLDSVLLEILNNKVAAAADQMYVTLQRASRSTYVKEAADFGVALVDGDGLVFGYPPSATIQFLIDSDGGPTIRSVPDLAPGDVIMVNDPYSSRGLSTHLPDLHMLRPYFHKGRIMCFGWCFIHCTDIGGRVPSSIAPSNHDIFQEGLIIPPTKIVVGGQPNEDFFTLFRANTRAPEINMGDIRAMLGALEIGAQRVADVIQQHGEAAFLACQKDLQDYTAAKARQVLRLIPDGAYEFWDYMDDDMVTSIPLKVRVRLEARDGKINLDLSHSDPQVAAAYNVPTMGGRNYWLTMRLTTFMTTHDPTMAMNAGLYRHITVTNPPGTVLNAEFPDAIGIRQAPARRFNDAVTGAILKAVPDKMAAPTCGAACPFVLAEYDVSGRRRTVSVLEPLRGGMGALKGQDGVDARDNTLNNMKNHPLETIEADCGVLVRTYDVRTDSGGPGEWRGGVGQAVMIEILRDGGTVLARGMERLRFPAWGVAGGGPGAPFRAVLNQGRPNERALPKIDQLAVDAGDTVTFMLPGASGYGDPYLREPERVRRDVEQGFVSRAGAVRDYGVAVDEAGRVDEAETRRLRTARIKDNVRADFDFGPEREAWEAVFDDALMCELNRRLMALPRSVRQARRRWIFDQAVPDLPMAGGAGSLAHVLADPDAVRARLTGAMAAAIGS